MPPIHIEHLHGMSHAEARRTIDSLATDLAQRHAVCCTWHGDRLDFNRAGLTGSIEVRDDRICVEAELGMLLRPLQGMLTEEMRAMLLARFPSPDDNC